MCSGVLGEELPTMCSFRPQKFSERRRGWQCPVQGMMCSAQTCAQTPLHQNQPNPLCLLLEVSVPVFALTFYQRCSMSGILCP